MKTVLETEDGTVWTVRMLAADGTVRQEQRAISVADLCRSIRRSRRQVYRDLRRGVIRPVGKYLGEWLVDADAAAAWTGGAGGASRIPKSARPLFPEFDFQTLHPSRHAGIVMHRLLEEGNIAEWRWLFAHYGRDAVAGWLEREGWKLSPRSARLWSWWLGVRPPSGRPLGRPS